MLKLHISKLLLLLLLLLLTGFSATYFLQRQAFKAAHQIQQENFDYQTREMILRIEQRLSAYEQVLLGTKALFVASKNVTRNEFRDYVGNLYLENRYPGIQGVGFSLIIQPSEKAKHIQAVRNEGFPNYTLRPEGERDIYTSIIYLEPFTGRNLRAFGYDMFSEAVRHTAMEQARDFDKTAISGKVILLQETEQQVQAGFLMYVPVYRNDLSHDTIEERRANSIGWVYAPFRMNDLMQGILGEQVKKIDLQIYDAEVTTPEALMYNKAGDLLQHQTDTAQYRFSRNLELIGHTWTVNIKSLPTFEANINTEQVTMIRLTGVLTTLLLTLLIALLASGRLRALKLAELMTRDLRDSEERFKSLFTQAPVGIAIIDSLTGHIYNANAKYAAIVGLSVDELQHIDWMKITHPDDVQADLDNMALMNAGKTNGFVMEKRYIHANGSFVWINLTVAKMSLREQDNPCHHCIVEDITERKQAEVALQERTEALARANIELLESESRFYTVANAAPVLIWMSDTDKLCFWFNQVWLNFTGRTSEQEFGNGWAEGVHPDDMNHCLDVYISHFERHVPFRMEYRLKHHDGEYHWIDDNGVPRFDVDGNFLGYIGSCTDITDRKLAEQKIAAQNLRYQTLLRSSMDGIHVIDVDGNVVDANETFCRQVGYSFEETLKLNVTQWDAQWSAEEVLRVLRELISSGKAKQFETRHQRKDGSIIDVEINSVPVVVEGRSLLFASARDITERKTMEIAREAALSLLQKIANRVPGVVYQYHLRRNGSSCFPFASEGIREIYRVSPEEVCQDDSKVFSIFHPDDYDGIVNSILQSARNLTQWKYEYRVKFDDGIVRWLLGNALPERGTDGSTLWHGFITDIGVVTT